MTDVDPALTEGVERRRTREFPLTGYFLIVSLVVMGSVTALTVWFSVEEMDEEVVRTSVSYAEDIVANLFHQVEQEYLAPLMARGETYDHTNPTHVASLKKVVDRAIYSHHVQKLYFFDTTGLIIYSTQPEHIDAQVPRENELYFEAVGGEVSHALKRRNDPLDIAGDPTAEELLETYVPVHWKTLGDPEPVAGVIEIYQDIGDLRRELLRSRRRIVTVALCSLGALFVVFTYFIVRADRVIRQRRRDLVQSNQALQDLSHNLEALVAKRTQQLLEKEKLASIGGLAAGVAHEINTPLATIAACSEGSSQRLKELPVDDSSLLSEIQTYLDLIDSEAFHCKSILRSLLEYAHEGAVPDRSELDLNGLVEQTVALLRVNRELRDCSIETELDAGLPPVSGDPVQIRQVIHNLIDNAGHAVQNTGNPTIAIRTFTRGQEVCLECEDNGRGIPQGIRESIFEPFFTTKPSREGIGLGLALSFKIVQNHGGSLRLLRSRTTRELDSSEESTGSVFRLTLPAENVLDPGEQS